MFEHHINSGWIHFLAQGAAPGQIGNPGDQLPLLATRPVPAGDADAPLPIPANGQGLSVLIYPDANQTPYVGLLQALYPGGATLPAIDGRFPYVVPPEALARTRGVTATWENGGLRTVVPTFGAVPPGVAFPATVQWEAGVRLPESGRYAFRLTGPRSA